MRIRFLLDENLDPRIITGLLRRDGMIDIQRVGDPGAPPRATADPDILRYVEREQRLLVTNNRESMAVHMAAHYAAGGRHWGIFQLRNRATLGAVIAALHILWGASEAEEWLDATDWIP